MKTYGRGTESRFVPHGAARVRIRDELLANFFSLLRRSFLRSETEEQRLRVYRASASTVYRLCGHSWAQQTIFPEQTALVRRFLSETGLQISDPAPVIQRSLMGNPWVSAWADLLHALPAENFLELCRVEGIERLREALATGRGVVLTHSHTLFAQLFWTWLQRSGMEAGVIIWRWAWGKNAEERRNPQLRAPETARELHSAVSALRRGEMVHIVADGDKGSEQIVLPFCNRLRGFRPTFAELALRTRSELLAASVHLLPDGGMHIEIEDTFSGPLPAANGATRVEALVKRYADHLHKLWQQHPADIPWFQMKHHLALPWVSR